jgi:hypothetical protein
MERSIYLLLLSLRFGFIGYDSRTPRLLPSGPRVQREKCAPAGMFTRFRRVAPSPAIPQIMPRTSRALAHWSKLVWQERSNPRPDITGSAICSSGKVWIRNSKGARLESRWKTSRQHWNVSWFYSVSGTEFLSSTFKEATTASSPILYSSLRTIILS